MITYKNISYSAKTFYGVKFNPGDTKSVPGYINCPNMIRIIEHKVQPKSNKTYLFEEPVMQSNRGRKKKTIEPEKDSIVSNTEIQTNTSEEETTNGNPS